MGAMTRYEMSRNMFGPVIATIIEPVGSGLRL